MQANIWIREMEKELKIIKPTQNIKQFTRTLENSINLGYPVLLEDIGETIDPVLEPLLQKQIVKQGGIYVVRIGDNPVEYSTDFKFYITTKLSRPHYAPEVCVRVAMLNFMVTEEGLEDQMLGVVVKHEEPKVDEEVYLASHYFREISKSHNRQRIKRF